MPDNSVTQTQHQTNLPLKQHENMDSGKQNRNKSEAELDYNFSRMQMPTSLSAQEESGKQLHSSSRATESNLYTQRELSEYLDSSDRSLFLQKYNNLAKKHSVRLMSGHEFKSSTENLRSLSARQESWFSRKILRRQSSIQMIKYNSDRNLRHRRSFSEISTKLKNRKDKLKFKDLQELNRLCGASFLYLPTEYAAGSLLLPTCFRALAQHLVKHGTNVRDLFRIPGSNSIVNDIYNYYCYCDKSNEIFTGTVRSPTLPDHIKCDVYDVASALKRFLIGLPGGILGSLTLFDAFISIKTQLNGGPEVSKTNLSSIRARLIALAVLTLRSQYRRALICAIFGLLSMIGRAAETAKREDEFGRQLPTSDLMGYRPLGIIFGPILTGNLLEDFNMQILPPKGGLSLLPLTPPKSKKERKNVSVKSHDESKAVYLQKDKIEVANGVTEMLITQWRDVVRHLRILATQHGSRNTAKSTSMKNKHSILRPYASESFTLRKPPKWTELSRAQKPEEKFTSTLTTGSVNSEATNSNEVNHTTLRNHPSRSRSFSNHGVLSRKSLSILSMTAEETPNYRIDFSPIPNTKCIIESSNNLNVSTQPIAKYKSVDLENSGPKLLNKKGDPEILATYFTQKTPNSRIGESLTGKNNSYVNISSPRKINKASEDVIQYERVTKNHDIVNENQAEVSVNQSFLLGNFMRKLTPILREQLHLKVDSSRLRANINGMTSMAPTKEAKRLCQVPVDFETVFPHNTPQNSGIQSTLISSSRNCPYKTTSPPPCDDLKHPSNSAKESKSSKGVQAHRLSQEENLGSTKKFYKVLGSGFSHEIDAGIGTKHKDQNVSIKILLNQNEGNNQRGKIDCYMNQNNECDSISSTITRSTSNRSQKMLELLAKFDAGVCDPREPSQKTITPSTIRHNPSPVDIQNSGSQFKDRLLASYTTNSPSPSKSRMSHRSDVTLKGTPSLFNFEEIKIADTKIPHSKPILSKLPTQENTVIRQLVPVTREHKIISSPFNSSPCPFPLRSVKSSIENPSKVIPEQSVEISSAFSSPHQSEGHRSAESRLLNLLSDSTNSRNSKGILPKLSFQRSPTRNIHPRLLTSSTETLHHSYSDKSSTTRCLSTDNFADQLYCNSGPQEASCHQKTMSPILIATTGRSNPLLFDQVRGLQRQLNRKYDEIQKLRQQLGIRQNIIISSLKEQLQDSEKSVQFWQERAKLYEQRFHTLNHSLSEFSPPQNSYQHIPFTRRTKA